METVDCNFLGTWNNLTLWRTKVTFNQHQSFLDSTIETDGVIEQVHWWGQCTIPANTGVSDLDKLFKVKPWDGPLRIRDVMPCDYKIYIPSILLQIRTIGGTYVSFKIAHSSDEIPLTTGLKKVTILSYCSPLYVLRGLDYEIRNAMDGGKYIAENEFGAVYSREKLLNFTNYTGVKSDGIIPEPEEEEPRARREFRVWNRKDNDRKPREYRRSSGTTATSSSRRGGKPK